jgi:hypothetical protein
MKRLLVTAAALGIAAGGFAHAGSDTVKQGSSDMWDVACSDFIGASEDEQREIVASLEKEGTGDRSAATGSAAEAESNMAINSGADVSQGTRGTDQSGTAAVTGESAGAGDPAGTTYTEVSVDDVVVACESSPSTRVSEVIGQQQMQ